MPTSDTGQLNNFHFVEVDCQDRAALGKPYRKIVASFCVVTSPAWYGTIRRKRTLIHNLSRVHRDRCEHVGADQDRLPFIKARQMHILAAGPPP